jgi:hypothetical protein
MSDVAVAAAIARASVDAYGDAPLITGVDQSAPSDLVTRIYVGSSLVNPQVAALLSGAEDFPVEFVEMTETEESGGATFIRRTRLDGVVEDLHSTEADDYAVVARFPRARHPGHYEFIVAGSHAEGTLGGGAWLAENWRRFNGANPRCGVLLKVRRQRPTEDWVELGARGLISAADASKRWHWPWARPTPENASLD